MMIKQDMDKVNPSHIQNEKNLYHGTSEEALVEIETSGFNRSHSGKNGKSSIPFIVASPKDNWWTVQWIFYAKVKIKPLIASFMLEYGITIMPMQQYLYYVCLDKYHVF